MCFRKYFPRRRHTSSVKTNELVKRNKKNTKQNRFDTHFAYNEF